MIRALEIRDLVVIESAALEPAPGLTVITGETGAGKTVLAQALELLAGGTADVRAVRPGARHALETPIFSPPTGWMLPGRLRRLRAVRRVVPTRVPSSRD